MTALLMLGSTIFLGGVFITITECIYRHVSGGDR